jgi:hypothetical protein
MKYLFKTVLFISSLVLMLSCEKEKQQVVDTELASYVDSFFLAANRLGINMKAADYNYSVVFGKLENSTTGFCSSSGDENNVTIDSNSWKILDSDYRYFLIFHELGHCILKRPHYNQSFQNGECKSWMRGREDGFRCTANLRSKKWKEYYERELFLQERMLPEWYDLDRVPVNRSPANPDFIKIDTILTEDGLELSNPYAEEENFQILVDLKYRPGDDKFFSIQFDILTILDNSESDGAQIWVKKYFENGFGNEVVSLTRTFDKLKDTVRVQIEKENGLYYFYIDGKIVHVMDFIPWTENSIIINSVYAVVGIDVEVTVEVFKY